jgi:hypothetical protein
VARKEKTSQMTPMSAEQKLTDYHSSDIEVEPHVYEVGKIKFFIQPVHKASCAKTISDAIFTLSANHAANH